MASTNPEPTALQALKGNSSSRLNSKAAKEDPRDEPVPGAPDLAPPAILEGQTYAVEEWERLAPELVRLGMLTIADVQTMCGYCLAYAQWRLLAEEWTPDGVTTYTSQGSPTMHPDCKAMLELHRTMLQYSDRMGLNPSARTRVRVKKPDWAIDPKVTNKYFQ